MLLVRLDIGYPPQSPCRCFNGEFTTLAHVYFNGLKFFMNALIVYQPAIAVEGYSSSAFFMINRDLLDGGYLKFILHGQELYSMH